MANDAGKSIANLTIVERLKFVLPRTASSVPPEAGRELLALLRPEALALMAVTLGVWAGSHFFGVGEIADVVLMIVGYAALGGVALEAAEHITAAIKSIVQGKTETDLYAAADDLTTAISLLTVQIVLTILFRRKPDTTFKRPLKEWAPPYSTFPKSLPRNSRFRYKPSTTFTKTLNANFGKTNLLGDIRVGRNFYPETLNPMQHLRESLFHEQVHQFLRPKLYVLRELRLYAAQSAYYRSYLLRFLEEFLAEMIAKFRVHGLDPGQFKEGLHLTMADNHQLTFAAMGEEAQGLLLGPVIAGGMVFNVYYGMQETAPAGTNSQHTIGK